MSKIDIFDKDNNEYILLFDYYKNLLTDKQSKYFSLYFLENLTLQEISDEFSISRNAIFDAIKKSIKILCNYEEKLGLFKKGTNLKLKLNEYKNNHLSINELEKIIEEEF